MADNRFMDMLKNVTEPRSPSVKSKHSPIDFGASVERDAKVVSTFQRLHQILPASQPANNPDKEPDSHPANNPDDKPDKYLDSLIEPDSYPDHNPVHDLANDPDHNPDKPPHAYPDHNPDKYPDKPIDPRLWHPFTEKQGKILLYLIEAGGTSNRQHIADGTGINVATVKHTLRILVREQYISNVKVLYNHNQRGLQYHINPEKCNEFYIRIKGYPANYPDHRSDTYPDNNPARVAYKIAVPLYSSSKKTTTRLSGAELLYWEDAGLAERHAMAWCKEFEITDEELRQQLAWARWDIIENRKGETVEKPLNWLYGVLRRTGGCYPRPENYLTPAEHRLQDMKIEAKRLEEARSQSRQIELELEFQRIMDDPDADEYQQLHAQLNDFEKQQKGKILEMGLRRVFQASKETKP
jgi:DNA-binding Lrp family transcriptional regulator